MHFAKQIDAFLVYSYINALSTVVLFYRLANDNMDADNYRMYLHVLFMGDHRLTDRQLHIVST